MIRPASADCPICRSGHLEPFLRIDAIPVMTTQMWADAEQATSAPRGDLDLAICDRCAAIRNLAFDSGKIEYTGEYENSQMFSGAFHAYAEGLARNLVDEFRLDRGTVVELGAGKGEFLEMLCAAGAARGIGYDPSYEGEVDGSAVASRITIHRRLFGDQDDAAGDLVVSRHVFEHLEDPFVVLRAVRAGFDRHPGSIYVEVPDARYVLTTEGMWDLIYPHVTYFGPTALTALAGAAGFVPTRCETAFGGQFLTLVASPSEQASVQPPVDEVAELRTAARRFGEEFADLVTRWRELLAGGRGTALWGAGAKGVTFLNALSAEVGVDVVVDVNPRKHGHFLPGTGHEVLDPAELRSIRPDRVILMNPMYVDEVRAALADLDVDAEVLVA